MKNPLFRLMALLSVYVIISCSANVNVKVMSEYKNINLTDTVTIGIYPDIQNIIIENESSLTDDLGEGDPRTIFYHFIRESLPVEIINNTHFKNAIILDEKVKTKLENRQLEINVHDSMNIRLPLEGHTFLSDTLRIDFVLFLQNIKTYEITMSFGNASSNRVLNCSFEFLIWDNKKGKIVSYGKGTSSESVTITMNKITWRKVVAGMSLLIANDMPFDRRTRS